MPSVYSEAARIAARELRARLQQDLAAGRFVSSSPVADQCHPVATDKKRITRRTSDGRKG